MVGRSSIQKEIAAGGDVAGGDIIHTHSYNPGPKSTLRELAERIRLEREDEQARGFIAELQHFAKPRAHEQGRDLQEKLRTASRLDLLPDAIAWKEQFYKKLSKFQFSHQAQELFVHILSKINTFFVYRIRPQVLAGATRTEIDGFIYTLIEELYQEVGDSELDITMTDLHGMVYFLAGNCHIDWN